MTIGATEMTSEVNGNGTISEKPVIRLCHIIKWPDYDGYGFNLHAEKNKPGQYIGKVDEGSPAEAAGLREGDRIIQVNGVDISNDDHKAVVNRIKQIPNETKLLVVDKKNSEYFANNNITITSSLPEVITIKTPERPAKEEIANGDVKDVKNDEDGRSSSISSGSPKSERSEGSEDKPKLNLNMSAKELRDQLISKKKFDPKKEQMDLKKKHDIIDKM